MCIALHFFKSLLIPGSGESDWISHHVSSGLVQRIKRYKTQNKLKQKNTNLIAITTVLTSLMHSLKGYQGSLGAPKADFETHYLTTDNSKTSYFIVSIKGGFFYKHPNFKTESYF